MYKLVDDLRLGRNLHFDVEYISNKPASRSLKSQNGNLASSSILMEENLKFENKFQICKMCHPARQTHFVFDKVC